MRRRVGLARAGNWEQLIKDRLLAQVAESCRLQSGRSNAEDSMTQARAQAAALRARTGSLRGASALLFGGAPVPPGPETDAAIQNLFHSSARTGQQERELQSALAEVDAIPQKRCLRVNLRMTGRQVASLKPAAGPGGSGWRNSHIQCLYADPGGP